MNPSVSQTDSGVMSFTKSHTSRALVGSLNHVITRWDLLSPRPPGVAARAIGRGAIVAAVLLMLAGAIESLTETSSWLYSLVPAIGGVVWSFRAYASVPPLLDREERRRRDAEVALSHEREKLASSRSHTVSELARVRQQIARLIELSERMRALDASVYEARLGAFERTQTRLEEYVRACQQLIADYERADAMLAIELDALQVMQFRPDATGAALVSRLQDLEELGDELHRRQLLLAADAEVDQLLREESPGWRNG